MSSAAGCTRLTGPTDRARTSPPDGVVYMTTHSYSAVHSRVRAFVRAAVIATTIACSAMPAQAQLTATDLADPTLDDLTRHGLSVTTASGSAESLLDAPARMQLITDHQIRRRARSLSDVLQDLPD